jgi:CYTH domain-containing protein
VPLEIERRFLVVGDGWLSHVSAEQELRQGYLTSGADALTLRVRISRSQQQPPMARLTLKAPPVAEAWPDGLVRQEFEYPIPLHDAEALLALTPRQLGKTRHRLDLEGGDWVVDVFADANAPLVIAEVELDRPDAPVTPPPWCGQELTGAHAFSNAALASTPLAHWPADRLQPLLAQLRGDQVPSAPGEARPGAL